MAIFENPNFDFLKWRWLAVGLSLFIIAAGAILMTIRGGPALASAT
jgi:hypothetical protein